MRRAISALSMIVLSVAWSAIPAVGATLDIYPDGSGPYPTLQHALYAAQPGDTLRLADGVFTGAGNRDLEMGGIELTIRSASADPDLCIIDLEGDGRAFLIQSVPGTDVRIEAITLRGGNPNALPPELLGGYGGGLAVRGLAGGGSVRVERCVFEDGRAEAGGGAFVYQAPAAFLACTFRRNVATDGAGAYCGYCTTGGGVRFEGCLFHGNDYPYPSVGGYGAGIYYSHSLGLVQSCTLAYNRAWLGAGLLVSTASTVDVVGALIAFSPEGQGLAVNAGTVTVSHCDIHGNQGGDWVGAIAGYLGLDCNFTADPFFCDAPADDFTLRGDSPCLPENSGGCGLIGALAQGCPAPFSDVGAAPLALADPEWVRVLPSPGRASATIAYQVARAGQVRLQLYTAEGRCVATLVDGYHTVGEYRLTNWRCAEDRGQPLAAGWYSLRYETASGQVSRPIVLAP